MAAYHVALVGCDGCARKLCEHLRLVGGAEISLVKPRDAPPTALATLSKMVDAAAAASGGGGARVELARPVCVAFAPLRRFMACWAMCERAKGRCCARVSPPLARSALPDANGAHQRRNPS